MDETLIKRMTMERLVRPYLVIAALAALFALTPERGTCMERKPVQLPQPRIESGVSLERALKERRSVREYRSAPLTLAETGQLLWAAQGITSRGGFRTAPSAGALYPLEVYLVAGEVEGLPAGVYRYRPAGHLLEQVDAGDRRHLLCDAALGQRWVRTAPAVIVIAAVYSRTTEKYSTRGTRYVHLDAGCAAENVYLQATALSLGTVLVGAFGDGDVQKALSLPRDEEPLCIMPVGRR